MYHGPVVPGMRTDAGRGGRAVVRTAAQVVAADPVLWLLGIVGFGVRGGLVLLTLPVLTVPSPVLLSIIFRGQIGTSGTNASFDLLAVLSAALTGLLVLVAILVSAWVELNAFERCAIAPRSETLRLGREPRILAPRDRRSLLLWVAAIQSCGLVPLLLLVLLFVGRLGVVVATELERPSDLTSPLISRVLGDAAPALLGMLLVIALTEVLVSLASRRLMAARMGLLPDGAGEPGEGRLALHGALRAVRQPLRVLGIAAISWLTALGAIVLAVGSLGLIWSTTRASLIALARPSDPGAFLGACITAVLLSGAWLAAFGLCGLAAAFRGSLWTMDTFR